MASIKPSGCRVLTSSGRGRRVLLPDEEPGGTTRQRCNARIAWLLITNRMLGRHPEFSRRKPFLGALLERGRKVDPSTVSRWEAGSMEVSDRTVALYEEVLGLPASSLAAVNAGIRRTSGDSSTPHGHHEAPTDLFALDLEPLVDRVSAGGGTGGDWLELTHSLADFRYVRFPPEVWIRLSDRIVEGLSTSVGWAFVRRYEAAVDLLHRPEAVQHLSRAISEFLTTPDVQSVHPVMALWTEVDTEEAGALTTRLLASDNPMARSAAAWTVSVKLARGHTAGMAAAAIEAYVEHGLQQSDAGSELLESANVAAHLPDRSWDRISSTLGDNPGVSMAQVARESGELRAGEWAPTIADDLARTAIAETPAPVSVGHDPMLQRLVREAVLDVDPARRQQAGITISASPYAPAVARQCHAWGHSEHAVLAARVQELLVSLSDADHGSTPRILENALAEPREAIRARALGAIGVRPSGLDAQEDAAIVGHTLEAETPSDRAAGLFALGMAGSASLGRLAGHDAIGSAALWWERHGPALRDPDAGGG